MSSNGIEPLTKPRDMLARSRLGNVLRRPPHACLMQLDATAGSD